VGADLLHANGRRTNMTKLIVAFQTLAKVPKNVLPMPEFEHRTVQPLA